MRRRDFLVAAGGVLLLAGCARQGVTRIDHSSAASSDYFVVVDVGGRAVVRGLNVARGIGYDLFELGFSSSELVWARCSFVPGGAVVSLVRGNEGTRHLHLDKKRGGLTDIGAKSQAGDASAAGALIWELGPRATFDALDLSGRAKFSGTLPFEIPTRLAVSGQRPFALGRSASQSPVVSELGAGGRILRSVVVPRGGICTDVVADGDHLYLSVVADTSVTSSDQRNEILRIDAAGGVTRWGGEWHAPRLMTSLGAIAIAVDDTREDGRFITAVNADGERAWTTKLPSAEPVVGIRYCEPKKSVVVVQSDAVSLLSDKMVIRLPGRGRIISEW